MTYSPYLPPGYATRILPSLLYRTPSTDMNDSLLELTSIETRFVHPENAPEPKLVSVDGRNTFVKLVHDENALFPIVLTPSGIVKNLKPEQPLNVLDSIVLTVPGIVTLSKLLHHINASLPIEVTPS